MFATPKEVVKDYLKARRPRWMEIASLFASHSLEDIAGKNTKLAFAVTVSAIVVHQESVLLVRSQQKGEDWTPPQGELVKGEAFTGAAMRLVQSESQIQTAPCALPYLGMEVIEAEKDGQRARLDFRVALCLDDSVTLLPVVSRVDDVRWVSMGETWASKRQINQALAIHPARSPVSQPLLGALMAPAAE